MADERKDLFKLHRDKQEKYIYYLIALAVAAVGFSLSKTFDQPLKYSQLPLGLAVLCWALSIHNGLKFLQFDLATLYANLALFDIVEGRHELSGNHPEKIKIGIESVQSAMHDNANSGQNHSFWQIRFLYVGIILFLIWRFLEMYLLTKG